MIRLLKRHWQWRLERFYRRNRWHIIADLSLLVIIIVLAVVYASLYFYRPHFSWGTVWGQPKPEIDLKNPPLALSFSAPQTNFKLADGADLNITLNNGGNLELNDITVNLTLASPDFSLAKIIVAEGQTENQTDLKISDRQLSVAKLAAKTALEIKLKVFFEAKKAAGKIISWQAQSSYVYGGQTIKDSRALPDLKIKSKLSAQAVAYYNSPQGDQLGVGPLPPVVGVPTTYWLFFEAQADGSFQDFVMSGKLPSGLELTGQRSVLAGEFNYNKATRQVLWQLKEVAAGSSSYRVGFEVSFMPQESQIGKISPLLTAIKYYSQDSVTGENQESGLPDLSTNLDFDKLNHGQGRVSQP